MTESMRWEGLLRDHPIQNPAQSMATQIELQLKKSLRQSKGLTTPSSLTRRVFLFGCAQTLQYK